MNELTDPSDPAVEKTLADIRATLKTNGTPTLFEAMKPRPPYLAASWSRYRAVMEHGGVDRKAKEFVGLATAVAKSSDYMVAFQRDRLARIDTEPTEIIEALAVADFFEGFDAFAHALHVDSELRPRRLMSGDFSLVDKEIEVNVPYVKESQDPIVQRVYGEIQKTFGIPFVPNIFKALAHCPAALETKWNSYKAVMLRGKVSRLTKELVAVAVSAVNGCFY